MNFIFFKKKHITILECHGEYSSKSDKKTATCIIYQGQEMQQKV